MFKFEKLFAPKIDVMLTDEDKGTIADKLVKHEEIWKVDKKYLYNKINYLTRKLSKCKPEEVISLQDRIALCEEMINDYEIIKREYLKKNKEPAKVSIVKDFWYYITSQDVRDEKGKIRLGRTRE